MSTFEAPADSAIVSATVAPVVEMSWQGIAASNGVLLGGVAISTLWQGIADSSVPVAADAYPSMLIVVVVDESIVAATACSAPSIFWESIEESILSASGAAGYVLFIVDVDHGVSSDSNAESASIYGMSAVSIIEAVTGLQFVADFTDGWAYNLNTGAASFYEQFRFNSFAQIDGDIYGANESGIYLIGSDDDAGEPIDATITLGQSKLGSDFVKSVPAIYAVAKSAQPMLLTCRVEGSEYSYSFSRETATMEPCKVKPGKGLKGTLWQIEIANTAGANLDLDSLSVLVAPTSRRV
jgi:hypothetical protein